MERSVQTGSDAIGAVDSSLPPQRDPLRTWAGHGTGVTCNGCGEPIEAHQVEYEVELPPGNGVPVLNFHLACYRTWVARRER